MKKSNIFGNFVIFIKTIFTKRKFYFSGERNFLLRLALTITTCSDFAQMEAVSGGRRNCYLLCASLSHCFFAYV